MTFIVQKNKHQFYTDKVKETQNKKKKTVKYHLLTLRISPARSD